MKRLLAIVVVFALIILARAQFTSALAAPASGTWMMAPGALAQARSGAASVRLYDGRVLVIGGYQSGSAGPVASTAVDAFSPTGTSVPVAPMKTPRAHHTATLLYDGTVLVTGGDTAAGTPTATAELYNPFTDTWSFVAPMAEARSRHTATFLEDGRVVVAGGGSVEIYEPWYGTFSFGGVLTPARSSHAAALLKDGRVLIAGGSNADGPLDAVDAFQDGVGMTAIGTLSIARSALTATTLLDGRVLLAGGRSASGDVPTLETFDPVTGNIAVESATLQAPRSGHAAFLLPDNNTVAIVGGTSADVPQAAAELVVPWTGVVRATGAMLHARSDAVGAPLDPPGALLVAGGWDGQAYESSAEVYGFATVRTDKSDYAPGETVTISGNGWQPGETVTLVLKESPAIDPDKTFTVVADDSGHIVNTDFATDAGDLGVRFYLTATGQAAEAENTFTDAKGTITGTVTSSAPGHAPIAGATVTCDTGCNQASVTTTGPNGGYSLTVNFNQSPAMLHLTVTAAGFSNGGRDVTVTNGGTVTGQDISLTPLDTTPPTVTSIAAGGTTPTNTSSVTWSVTFSENVSNVDIGDFALAASGLTGTSITSVAGGPLTYTVVASTGTGTGTLGLNLVDNDSITDTAGNKLGGTGAGNGSFTGAVYTIDRTAPTVTATPDRAADHNGWYNHSLTVTFSSTDADVASCDTAVSYSGPESSTASVTGHCTDTVGNVGSATFSFKYDATGPSATLAVTAGTAGANGWYISDVTLHTSGTDAVSGIESCTADQNQTAETAGATFSGSCTNNAGLTTDASPVTVKVDKTGPTATLTPSGTLGSNGWYVSDVTITTSGIDTISTPVTCSAAQTQTADTTGTSFNGSCTNAAGLTTSATPLTVKRDATPPAVTATLSRAPDHGTWFNQPVSVHFTATDSTSGVASCAQDSNYDGPDASAATVSGSCTDNAGNSSSGSVTFPYDATAPSNVSGVFSRPTDHGDWYNHAVGITFSGEDAVSGVDTCTSTTYSGPDKSGAGVPGTCTDHAGNTSAPATVSFNYDATAPVSVSASADRTADSNGWFNHPLTVTWSGTDATAGIASCTTTPYSGPDATSVSLTGSCSDAAGNTSSNVAFAFKYDATAPTVTATPARSPDHNGWYNNPVTITFSGTDAISGGVSCDAPVAYNAPDSKDASAAGGCTDAAGNTGHATYAFQYDATPPTATIAVASGTLGAHGWYTSDVTLHTSGTDAVSGIESCSADQVQMAETKGTAFNGSCTNGAGLTTNADAVTVKLDTTGPSANLAVTAGTLGKNDWYVTSVTLETSGDDSISSPVTCTAPQHQTADTSGATFSGSCTNDAGLTTNATAVTVKVDTTAPTVTATADRSPDFGGWYNHSLTVSFAATDSTSGVATCSPDASYSAPDTAAASVSRTCTDNAGNVGTGTLAFQYDATPPASVAGTADRAPNGQGWYNSPVTFTFSGVDPVSGIAHCSTAQYSMPDSASASVTGTCSDQAGNTSAAVTVPFKYDSTAPTGVSVSADRPADHNGWYNKPFTATWSGTDATSGIASCTSTSYTSPDTGSGSITGSCTDEAGNTADGVPFAFKYDSSGPSATLTVTNGTPGANGWYTSEVSLHTSGTDLVSGIESCTADQNQTAETAGTAFDGHCTNNAGLTTNAASVTVKLDETPPTAALSAIGTLGSNGWYTSDVTVHTSGADSISGPVTCTADQHLNIDSTGTPFYGSCTNNAGLSASAEALTVKRDATKPTLTPVVSPVPVILDGTANASPGAADATSGIASASCGAPVTNAVGSQSVSCTATDNAGNTNTATATYTVNYALAGTNCLGSPGLEVLQPININGSSVFKQKSTVPVKFRACDARGLSIGTPGVVRSFQMAGIAGANGAQVNEDIISTTPDVTFRWSSTDQLWIFNLDTKNLTPGLFYSYLISLNDGSQIPFSFGLK